MADTLSLNVPGNVDTKDELISFIKQTVGRLGSGNDPQLMAEVLIAIINYGGGGATSVVLDYMSSVLTATVNGVTSNPVTIVAGGGGGVAVYDAGEGMYVAASGAGITFNKDASTGAGQCIIPPGVTLYACRLHGDSSILAVDGTYLIEFNYSGVTTVNATNVFTPSISMYDRILGSTPSSPIPWTYNRGTVPGFEITSVASDGMVLRFTNLDLYSFWGLKIQFV